MFVWVSFEIHPQFYFLEGNLKILWDSDLIKPGLLRISLNLSFSTKNKSCLLGLLCGLAWEEISKM